MVYRHQPGIKSRLILFSMSLRKNATIILKKHSYIQTQGKGKIEKHYKLRSLSKNVQGGLSLNISPLHRICKLPPIGKSPRQHRALRTGLFFVVVK